MTTRASRAVLMLGTFILLLLLVGILTSTVEATPVTHIVKDPSNSIQDAINRAGPGDVVRVMEGWYSEFIYVNKAITVKGDHKGETIIWWSTGTVVSLDDGVTLDDVTIMGTYSTTGVRVQGDDCRLLDVNIKDCSYGISVTADSSLKMERCTVTRCLNDGLWLKKYGVNRFEHLTIIDSRFDDNIGSGILMERVRYVEMDNVSASKNTYWGIYATKVTWARLANSTLRTNDVGMKLLDSHGWTVEDTDISWNRWDGLELNESGAEIDNVFRRNQFSDNSRKLDADRAGVALLGRGASDNIFEDNLFADNPFGVRFNASGGCFYNTFHMNEFRKCEFAIWEGGGAGPNTFTMNNFIDNQHQAFKIHVSSLFDNGEHGNYWSDYLIHQPRAQRVGVVWDSPYNVIWGTLVFDMFPLAYPYEEDPPVIDLGTDHNVSFAQTETITAQVKDASAIDGHLWTITDPGGKVTSYSTLNPMVTYTFRKLGTFWVEVQITDIWGAFSIDSVQVTVVDDVPPVAMAGEDIAVDLGTSIRLDATASYDNNGIASVRWVVDPYGLDLRFSESIVNLEIDSLGVYTATLFLIDYSGNSASDQVNITIQDLSPPIAKVKGDTTIGLGGRGTFDGSGSVDNVGIVDWSWTVSWPGTQMLFDDPVIIFTFKELGRYSLVLRVTDAAGQSDHVQLTVKVIDTERPDADAGDDVEVFMGVEVLLDATDSTDNVGIVRYVWSFVHSGTIRFLEGETRSWEFDRPGDHQVTLMVYDTAGNFDSDFMSVRVRDSEPPAVIFWSPDEGELGTSMVLDGSGSEDNVGVTTYEWKVIHRGAVETHKGVMIDVAFDTPGEYQVILTVRDAAGNEATAEGWIYVPPKATEAERPGWLVPTMVGCVGVAALLSYLFARRRYGAE